MTKIRKIFATSGTNCEILNYGQTVFLYKLLVFIVSDCVMRFHCYKFIKVQCLAQVPDH